MNRTYMLLRAARGPMLLITLGALLLLDRMSELGFARSWPLLVIVLGVLKLAERAALHAGENQPQGPPPPPGGTWS